MGVFSLFLFGILVSFVGPVIPLLSYHDLLKEIFYKLIFSTQGLLQVEHG